MARWHSKNSKPAAGEALALYARLHSPATLVWKRFPRHLLLSRSTRMVQKEEYPEEKSFLKNVVNRTKGLYDNCVKVAIYARVSATDPKCESQLREL